MNYIHPKVAASTLGAAVTTILIWIITLLFPSIHVPEIVSGAILTITTFGFGWITPSPKGG